ncbi:MAG: HYR domain-containing protein [Gaiellaceae bacterium]
MNVVDTTKPDVQSPPDIAVEANGPTGAKVNFPNPVAVDLVDGPVPNVSCSPASSSTFGLGTHVVNCSASDSHGNTASASIKVTVADTTPPNLLTPVSLGIHADSPTGIPRSNSTITSYLRSAIASDIVDPNPVVTNNAPDNLPIGTTDITYTARDASGNTTSKSSAIVVLPKPPPGTPPLPVPPAPTLPAEVKNVKVTPMDGAARIQWQAGGRQVMVTRSSSSNLKRSLAAIGDERVVYTGTASSYVDRGLENKVEYRYVVRAVDAAGNHSAGVAAVVVPRRDLLKSPKDGARLRKAPRLLWTPDAEAQYYNAQLLLNGAKVLSVWPKGPTYVMKKSWKFNGRKYTLKPGLYSWYVWPGFGARPVAQYGDLIGSRTFRIVR